MPSWPIGASTAAPVATADHVATAPPLLVRVPPVYAPDCQPKLESSDAMPLSPMPAPLSQKGATLAIGGRKTSCDAVKMRAPEERASCAELRERPRLDT